ncbi:MAG: septum formation initiator family protein [Bacteroidales bacterium]|nr:septum formation initiator family protein [Bacteroidales bacterium]MBO7141995.1 septum formation initiator family protein [Bacteroidales bacterium]
MKNLVQVAWNKFKDSRFGGFVCQHPYLVLIIAVFFHLCVTNQYNLYDMIKAKFTISKLRTELDAYQTKIQEDSIKLHNLRTDNRNLVKFAREVYHMKSDKEDVFIIRNN